MQEGAFHINTLFTLLFPYSNIVITPVMITINFTSEGQ